MTIHYFLFEALACPGSDNADQASGAFVNCWIKHDSPSQAQVQARRHIEDGGWCEVALKDYDLPERVWYFSNPEALEMYECAEEFGEGYIFNTWPPGSNDS